MPTGIAALTGGIDKRLPSPSMSSVALLLHVNEEKFQHEACKKFFISLPAIPGRLLNCSINWADAGNVNADVSSNRYVFRFIREVSRVIKSMPLRQEFNRNESRNGTNNS